MAVELEDVKSLVYTTAVVKLNKLTKRIRIVQGGTGAGKTYGIVPVLITYAIEHPGIHISIVSETVPHLRRGVYKDFRTIMEGSGQYKESDMNRTSLTYTFTNAKGQRSNIEFFSADQKDKTRGPRRDILYINECNNVDFETYFQLAIRTSQIIWLDFNPVQEFWVHTELLRDNDPDVDFLTLTYKDNEALPSAVVKEIEKGKTRAYHNPDLPAEELNEESNIKSLWWVNWWKVFGLGELGVIEGSILTDWIRVPMVPKEAFLLGFGLDFGYTNDPTAMVGIYKYNDKVYVHELFYDYELTNQDIVEKMRDAKIPDNAYIVADCSEPKSIAEINRYGFFVLPSKKGADSINFGLSLLQKTRLYVTESSVNLIKELRYYCWDKDRNGKTINRPIDSFNHAIDALRYVAMEKIGKKRKIGIILREYR